MDGKQRLDKYVSNALINLPRTYAKRLIDSNMVRVNSKIINKPSYTVKPDDIIEINDGNVEVDIPKIDIPIIYEDDDCVVINKPAGILSHSKGAFNNEATVATWLANKFNGESRGDRDGIVHRLDRATSGVMICAKNDNSLLFLQKQFSLRKVEKAYYALIKNSIKPAQAIIELPIERNPKKPQRFRVGANGKPATTRYKTVSNFNRNGEEYSLIELTPTTGRTHQLRVHLGYLKRPIVGDEFYDGPKADRLYLHSYKLKIKLPNGKVKSFVASLPEGFKGYDK